MTDRSVFYGLTDTAVDVRGVFSVKNHSSIQLMYQRLQVKYTGRADWPAAGLFGPITAFLQTDSPVKSFG